MDSSLHRRHFRRSSSSRLKADANLTAFESLRDEQLDAVCDNHATGLL